MRESERNRMKLIKYIVINGAFAWLAWMAVSYEGILGSAFIALSIMGFIGTAFAAMFGARISKENRPVPYWVDAVYDVCLALFLIRMGWPFMGVVTCLSMCCNAVVCLCGEKEEA